VAELLEHLAEVVELLQVGELGGELGGLLVEVVVVDVAHGDDVAELGDVVGVAVPLAADADAGAVELLLGRLAVGRPGGAAGGPEADAGGQGRGFLQELTTVLLTTHGEDSLCWRRKLRGSRGRRRVPAGVPPSGLPRFRHGGNEKAGFPEGNLVSA